MSAAVLDEFGLEFGPGCHAVDRLHDSLDLFTEFLVRNPKHRRIDELGVHDKKVLRLLRVDVDPARDDHERRPIGQVQVAVLVDIPHVAQRSPAVFVGDRRGLVGIFEVLEGRPALEEQLTGLTDGQFDSGVGHHVHRAERLANRTGMGQPLLRVDRRAGEPLCSPVILVNDGPEPRHHLMLDIHRARGGRVDHAPKTRDVVFAPDGVGQLEHPHEHGRHELGVRDAVGLDQAQNRLGVEPAHHDRGSTDSLNRHGVVDARRVVQRGRREIHARVRHAVALTERVLQHVLRPGAVAVFGEGPPDGFGPPRGAGRVKHFGTVGQRRRVTGRREDIVVRAPAGRLASDTDVDVDPGVRIQNSRRKLGHRRVDEHRPRV